MAGHEKNENIVKVTTRLQENGLIAVKRSIDPARRRLAKTFNPAVDKLEAFLEKEFLDSSDKAKVEICKLFIQTYLGVLKEDSAEKFKAKELLFRFPEQMDRQLGGSAVGESEDDLPLLDFENVMSVD